MRDIVLNANAKINLALDVMGVREDGYHLMDMVNVSVSLCDEVRLVKNGLGRTRLMDGRGEAEDGEKNLAVRAARALSEAAGLRGFGCDIELKKRIPMKAGLAGGSADAAAVLRGLVRLFSLELDESTRLRVGASVGADVPFCMTGGSARVGGIGDELRPIKNGCGLGFVILMPSGGRSTAEAFRRLDGAPRFERPDTDAVERALADGDISALAASVKNVFETSCGDPVTAGLRSALMDAGALGAALTGSGAAVYGLFDISSRGAGLPQVRAKGCRAFTAEARPSGVEITAEI